MEEVPLGGKDMDSKVRHLLRAEYLRRLSQYRRVDVLLTQKYGMSWETAIGCMKTMRRNIEELQEEGYELKGESSKL